MITSGYRFAHVVFAALVASSTAGAGCSSNDTSTPAPVKPGSLAAAAYARAAVIVGSCLPDDGIRRNLQSIYDAKLMPGLSNNLEITPDFVACLEKAGGGCAALDVCLGIKVDLSGPCANTCTGSVLTGCDGELKLTVDCARHGRSCVDGDCVLPMQEKCNFDTFMARCEGETRVTCGGEVNRQRCDQAGLTCKTAGTSPSPYCVGKGAACSATSSGGDEYEPIACSGDKLRACVSGGEHMLDCKVLGAEFSCQTKDGVAFCGVASECAPGKDPGTCAGSKVTFCNAGRVETVDCSALGFTGCGVNSRTAFCSPSPWSMAK